MQDAHVRNWARESHVSAEMLESVHELNHRFFDLVASQPSEWATAIPGQLAPLSVAQKRAAAGCPYALFDLRFHDDRHWRMRLQADGVRRVAEEAWVPDNTRNFARLALFFAWHVASSSKLAAQLLLGMTDATAAAFRGATIDWLPDLIATEAVNLTARWNNCPTYWSALTGAASRPNAAGLRRIQLYGLQLAAAARLS